MTRAKHESTEQQRADAGTEQELDLDTTFHLLQNERRRLVLRYLSEFETDDDGQFEMRGIAEQVAAWEHETTVRQLDSDERQRVYIGLYQNHLPTLAEQNVIEYDKSRGWVEPTERVTDLEPYLEPGPDAAPTQTDELTPPAADGGSAGQQRPKRTHLLAAAVGLVPMLVFAAQGSALAGTVALLVLVFVTGTFLGGWLQQAVGDRVAL